MEKMDGKTMDIVAENVVKLKELFPEAFTEGKIDFDALKEVLGEYVDNRDERYSFTWNGKSKARMIAQTPSTGTLRPCKEESVDWDTTQNIFIEGDNLEVLKLLQKSYHKKIKMIYIDPPYNTGKDFVYKDNFKDNIKNYKEITGQVDGAGRNLSSNPETSGRYHTDWLNMMYPRLKLARNLLKDDGVIFISIDDNEVSNLRKMCDEIFGEENFIAELIWKKRSTPPNDRVIAAQHEYIMCFVKDNNQRCLNLRPRTEKQIDRYKNPDNHPKGPWTAGDLMANVKGGRYVESLYFSIVNPRTNKEHYPSSNGNWRFNKDRIEQLIKNNEIYFGGDDNGRPKLKRFLCDVKEGITWTTLWDFVPFNTAGSSEMTSIFGNLTTFENPKPTGLIFDILRAGSNKDSIILDFFAGSATTAHAVMQLNAMDNGGRKCITVQLPESCDEKSEAYKAGYKTIAEIGKERIRRAAAKTKEKNPDYDGDLGFKVFKLDSTNIKPWEVDFDLNEKQMEMFVENIKPDRREEDVLYEVLLKYGLALDLPIEKWRVENGELRIIEEDDKETLNAQLSTLYSIGFCALVICLDDNITLETVEAITKLKEKQKPEIMRVVFKDSGFKDDVVKTNAVQILRTAGIVDVRSL
jgi:adenine-specific DNA-methyltransferase